MTVLFGVCLVLMVLAAFAIGFQKKKLLIKEPYGHSPYFQTLQKTLQTAGYYHPTCIIDINRLDENLDLLLRLTQKMPVRLVVKSLPSLELLTYCSDRLQTKRFMVFHSEHILPILDAFPGGDTHILMGKPLPTPGIAHLLAKSTATRVQEITARVVWLVDSRGRFDQLMDLSKTLQVTLKVCIEIDIGMHRGGFNVTRLQELHHCLSLCTRASSVAARAAVEFHGFMGYDAHVAKTPIPRLMSKVFATSQAVYRRFLDDVQKKHPKLFWDELQNSVPLILNGAGSLTFQFHGQDSVVNEVSLGSLLVKPGDFCGPHQTSFASCCFIGTPILKIWHGLEIPFVEKLSRVWSKLSNYRHKTLFIFGGYWKANPLSPEGLKYNQIYGHSSNQDMLNAAEFMQLKQDDFIFFLPTQSEAVMNQFNGILVVRDDQIIHHWSVMP